MYTEFFQDLRKSVIEIEGSAEAACTSIANITRVFYPHAEIIRGTFEGSDHEWVELEGKQYDICADQFGGPEYAEGSDIDDRWEGENEGGNEGVGILNEEAIISKMEELGYERQN